MKGGSYRRAKDGTLIRVEGTAPAATRNTRGPGDPGIVSGAAPAAAETSAPAPARAARPRKGKETTDA